MLIEQTSYFNKFEERKRTVSFIAAQQNVIDPVAVQFVGMQKIRWLNILKLEFYIEYFSRLIKKKDRYSKSENQILENGEENQK